MNLDLIFSYLGSCFLFSIQAFRVGGITEIVLEIGSLGAKPDLG